MATRRMECATEWHGAHSGFLIPVFSRHKNQRFTAKVPNPSRGWDWMEGWGAMRPLADNGWPFFSVSKWFGHFCRLSVTERSYTVTFSRAPELLYHTMLLCFTTPSYRAQAYTSVATPELQSLSTHPHLISYELVVSHPRNYTVTSFKGLPFELLHCCSKGVMEKRPRITSYLHRPHLLNNKVQAH